MVKYSELEKEKFDEAKRLSKLGDLNGVVAVMNELVEGNKSSPVFRSVLANALWELGKLELAETEFRHAVRLAPESENISLGLFHCLWDQNKIDEAFAEMKRFTKISVSDSYREIVKEINSKMGR